MRVIKESVAETTEGLNPESINLINQYAKAELKEEDVFTFSVLLCDNEIDRDNECFSTDSLNILSELFTGKTGIFDHDWKAQSQMARIYKTEVLTDPHELTQYGEQYTYLKAYVYMLKTEENSQIIAEINGGIKKEVSVGCSVKKKICSICGEEIDSPMCPHTKGQLYDGKMCFGILSEPTDAYEWSFVAVPAQKRAGVMKRYRNSISEYGCLKEYVQAEGNYRLEKELEDLEKYSEMGKRYLKRLYEETVELGIVSGSGFKREFLEKTLKNMGEEELLEYKKIFNKKIDEAFPPLFQLNTENKKCEKLVGDEFLI